MFRILDPVELGYPDLATLLAAVTDLFVLRCDAATRIFSVFLYSLYAPFSPSYFPLF
jgi:hypothetical protein